MKRAIDEKLIDAIEICYKENLISVRQFAKKFYDMGYNDGYNMTDSEKNSERQLAAMQRTK